MQPNMEGMRTIINKIIKMKKDIEQNPRTWEFINEKLILIFTVLSAIMVVFVFAFILQKSWGVFQKNGFGLIASQGFDNQIFSAAIAPGEKPVWQFGILGLLVGTLLTSLGALILSVPIGIGTAVVVSELCPRVIKPYLNALIKFLASVPSIVYGLIGLLVIVPFIKDNFVSLDIQLKFIKSYQVTGKSLLAGIVVLTIMVLPFVTALTIDALRAVPKRYKEAALALGFSHWRSVVKIIIPCAKSGIIAGIILSMGVAVGETIALSMVTGGKTVIPNLSQGFDSLLAPVLTLASAIINKTETMSVESASSLLFACGVILLLTSTLLSIISKSVEMYIKRKQNLTV